MGGSDAYSLTIYSEKDAGMYDAINKGLRKATGDICAYLNCDEQYLPEILRWVVDYFSVSPHDRGIIRGNHCDAVRWVVYL